MRSLLLSIAAMLVGLPAFAGFYDATPQQLTGPPGSVIRYRVMDTSPGAGTAVRVLYRSTGLRGADAYVAALCARGTPVRYIRYPKGSPHSVVRQSANQTVAWMGERFAGVPQRTPCGQ